MQSNSLQAVPVCDLCGNRQQTKLYQAEDLNQGKPGLWQLVRCDRCGAVFVNPRPTTAAIGEFYPQNYWHSYPTAAEIKASFKEIYDELTKLQPGRLLDVGTGGGFFPSLFENWQREATELSAQTAQQAAKHYGFPVYAGFVEDNVKSGQLQPDSFDLITLNHVIEHLYTPKETMKLLYELLHPGGHLMIATPNFNSLSARITGPFWYHLDPPRHLFLFTPRRLKSLLEESGFVVDHISYQHQQHNQAGYSISFSRYFAKSPHRLVRKLGGKFVYMTQGIAPRILAILGYGDVMAVYAHRP